MQPFAEAAIQAVRAFVRTSCLLSILSHSSMPRRGWSEVYSLAPKDLCVKAQGPGPGPRAARGGVATWPLALGSALVPWPVWHRVCGVGDRVLGAVFTQILPMDPAMFREKCPRVEHVRGFPGFGKVRNIGKNTKSYRIRVETGLHGLNT